MAPVYEVEVLAGKGASLGDFSGSMQITGWTATEYCLALPFNNVDYEFDPARSFDLLPRKYVKPERRRGNLRVESATEGVEVEFLKPYLVRLRPTVASPDAMARRVSLRFSGTLPRWPDADPEEWFFADFHPQPLVACPQAAERPLAFNPVPVAEIKAKIDLPKGWTLATPATPGKDGRLSFRGRNLAFAVAKSYFRARFGVSGTNVEVFFRTESFRGLIATIQKALTAHVELLGPLPFPRLIVVETAELEKSSLPGVIALNRPRVAALNAVQQDVLNWSRWQLTSFIAEQWYGASMLTALDDLWFLRGWTDFATSIALHSMTSVQDLFAEKDGEAPSLTFTYRQNQDLIAAALTYFQPYNALVDRQRRSGQDFEAQHSLSYIRHALALRHLYWAAGELEFKALARAYNEAHSFQRVDLKSFLAFVAAYEGLGDTARRKELVEVLSRWWMTDDWPDFWIDGVDRDAQDDGREKVTVVVGHDGDIAFPVTVRLREKDGTVHDAMSAWTANEEWAASFETKSGIDEVLVDPERKTFDWDRFDNTTSWPDFNFIPGNARTFADDEYTVFWLPLASQLPGEPFTLQLVSQTFRYIHAGITSVLAYVPSEKRLGFSMHYLTDMPRLGAYTIFDVIQDKGNSLRGERIVEAGIYKMPFLIKEPSLEVGLRVRSRQVLGQPETLHETIALKTQLIPLNSYGACTYSLKTENEEVPSFSTGAVRYGRHSALGDGACRLKFLPLEPDLGFRAFGGVLAKRGDTPDNVYFNPQDLKESRMRIDDPQLPASASIATVGADLLLPANLPLPDGIFALKRETRWRLFYDYGRSLVRESDAWVTYRDAGAGLFIPFGGDLVGKGSVAILNFSALVVLYRDAGGVVSRKPGFLFDFDFFGKL